MPTFQRAGSGGWRSATRLAAALIVTLGAITAPAAWAQGHEGHTAAGDFGTVDFPVPCDAAVRGTSTAASPCCTRSSIPKRRGRSRPSSRATPRAPMGYWGPAISQRPNPLTAPFQPALLARGWDEIQPRPARPYRHTAGACLDRRAGGLLRGPRHRAAARAHRACEARMAALHAGDPADVEAAALLRAVEARGSRSHRQGLHRQLSAATAILTPLGARLPSHPGVPHYMIHALRLCADRRTRPAGGASPRQRWHRPRRMRSTCRRTSSRRSAMWQDAIDANLAADHGQLRLRCAQRRGRRAEGRLHHRPLPSARLPGERLPAARRGREGRGHRGPPQLAERQRARRVDHRAHRLRGDSGPLRDRA